MNNNLFDYVTYTGTPSTEYPFKTNTPWYYSSFSSYGYNDNIMRDTISTMA